MELDEEQSTFFSKGDFLRGEDFFRDDYLRLTGKKLGLLINFGQEQVKDGVSRVVHNL